MRRRAVDNDHLGRLGPIELKLQDARLTPAQNLTVQRTTGCTPDVRYHNCRTHRSMLMVYGPPHSLHAAAELAEALVDFNAGLGHMPILAKYSQPTVLRQMMQPMHMHPMQPMQPMHMHPAHMQYTPPMGPIYLPRDCDLQIATDHRHCHIWYCLQYSHRPHLLYRSPLRASMVSCISSFVWSNSCIQIT